MTVAQTILSQLGGNKFIAMTGAKNLVADENSLTFSIGRNASKANKVRITLEANDLYRVEMFRIWKQGLECTKIVGVTDCTSENMKEFFTDYTGMHLSL